MRVLSNLLVIILLILGALVLIPLVGVGLALLGSVGFFVIWLLPVLIIAASDETTRGEKFCWILAIICLSWFAWIFYFFLAPLNPRPRHYYY